jgi:Choline dehydrogenase and related flavoproteins
MKKPAASSYYGSIDATLAETCCCSQHDSSSLAFCSPESSSDDLIISRSNNNNHQANILNLEYLSLSGKKKSKDHHGSLLKNFYQRRRRRVSFLIIIILLLLLLVEVSFRTISWPSHPDWQWSFHHQASSQIEERDQEYRKEQEYDYIIVGAGPAGLLVAFQLAKRLQQESMEAYGNTDHAGKVLVLESGTKSQSDVMTVLFQADAGEEEYKAGRAGRGKNAFDIPLLWSELSSKDDWSEYLSHHWPVDQTFLGRAVGGSGIHNAM